MTAATATASSSPQQMGGDASDMTKALATELVDFILGAPKRDHEQQQSTGTVVSDQEAKQQLINDVAAKIKAVTQPKPPAEAKPGSGTGSGEGRRS
jgi:hypothetical protein